MSILDIVRLVPKPDTDFETGLTSLWLGDVEEEGVEKPTEPWNAMNAEPAWNAIQPTLFKPKLRHDLSKYIINRNAYSLR